MKKKYFLWLFLGVLIFAFCTSTLLMLKKNNKNNKNDKITKNKISSFCGNVVNYGFITASNNKIYYVDLKGKLQLYTSNSIDGKVKMLVDKPVNNLVCNKNHIFYLNNDDLKIYRMDFKGLHRKNISNAEVRAFDVSGNYIYYINKKDRKLYKVGQDGKTSKLIYGDGIVNDMCVSDKHVYYSVYKKGLFSFDTSTKKQKNIVKDLVGEHGMAVCGKNVFYINGSDNDQIYKTDIDGSNREQYIKTPANCINVDNNKIYYTDKKDKLFYENIKGNVKAINTGKLAAFINIIKVPGKKKTTLFFADAALNKVSYLTIK